MLFSSNLFLFLFLPCVLAGYYLIPRRFRNLFLLIVSLIFYAWGTGFFVLVMIGSILYNYCMAFLLNWENNTNWTKFILAVTVAGNLSILFIYKYLDFCIANLNLLGFSIPLQNIVLPLGISFFTFQAMSYPLDVYYKTAKLQKSPLNVGLYVSFFPQLVAGPIVRYQTIADQIQERQETWDDFCIGVKRFIIGLSKKIILSNNMALVADAAFSLPASERSIVYAWMGALAYSFQILFDFSGYSDMAIGLGKMFGFHFLENFNYPYISSSVSEFWRRWHISLGQWFRDYVYFPLGGSRVKTKGRLVFNLFVVWFLTGVWHGASWNFIVWGLMYFVLITFEKLTGCPRCFATDWQLLCYRFFTILCIILGWVFFRASNLQTAVNYCLSMFGLCSNSFFDSNVVAAWVQYKFFFLLSLLCSAPVLPYLRNVISKHSNKLDAFIEIVSVPVYLFILIWSVSYIMVGSHNPFIYFNF